MTWQGERARDAGFAAVVCAVTIVYLGFIWPRYLVGLDEGAFVYEAKRIVDGQVMYRDFFDLTGPVAQYAFALIYALFGASMETGRVAMAVLHGVIVVLVYAIVRRLGVRPTLAAVCCLVDLALFYPAFALATPHWFSTAFVLLVYWFVLRAPVLGAGRAAAAGALTALAALTQQPKGAATAAAVGIVIVCDLWTARRALPFAGALLRQWGAFTLGLLALLLPTLGLFVALAGFQPVFEALVLTPLGAYREQPIVESGRWLMVALNLPLLRLLIASGSTMLLLNVMPFIIPLSAALLILQTLRRVSANDRRPLFVAVIFSTFSIVSVLYQPNHSHFAIVGPIWITLFAESLERLIRWLEGAFRTTAAGPVVVFSVLALVMLRVYVDLPAAWRNVGGVSETSFGRVHFLSQGPADDIEAVRVALQTAGAKHIFVYPCAAALYLMTETSNPTRFQLLLPGYSTEEQFAEVQQTLERERVPFVVRSFYWWGAAGDPTHQSDPLLPYLKTHYEPVKLPRPPGTLPTLSLFRRKAEGSDATHF